MNVILALDEGGNRIMQHSLEVESYPRSFNFMQSTHSFMVTFKGKDRKDLFDDDSRLFIDNINSHGESVWETALEVTGNVNGVVVVDDGLLISGNYTSIQDLENKTFVSEKGLGTYIMKLNHQGELINQLLFPKEEPYYTDIFFKTGDHAIHLFGSKKKYGNRHIEKDPSERVHFIFTKDLHMVSDSFVNEKISQ